MIAPRIDELLQAGIAVRPGGRGGQADRQINNYHHQLGEGVRGLPASARRVSVNLASPRENSEGKILPTPLVSPIGNDSEPTSVRFTMLSVWCRPTSRSRPRNLARGGSASSSSTRCPVGLRSRPGTRRSRTGGGGKTGSHRGHVPRQRIDLCPSAGRHRPRDVAGGSASSGGTAATQGGGATRL